MDGWGGGQRGEGGGRDGDGWRREEGRDGWVRGGARWMDGRRERWMGGGGCEEEMDG